MRTKALSTFPAGWLMYREATAVPLLLFFYHVVCNEHHKTTPQKWEDYSFIYIYTSIYNIAAILARP